MSLLKQMTVFFAKKKIVISECIFHLKFRGQLGWTGSVTGQHRKDLARLSDTGHGLNVNCIRFAMEGKTCFSILETATLGILDLNKKRRVLNSYTYFILELRENYVCAKRTVIF